MYSLLLLLSSLLHITTCTVYTVTPDDHYYPNTTCHHCHNLQHYLLNVTKYFTSNTQLLFLPGLHHLHTDLIIQNVHNISLIGSTTDGTTLDSVIQCKYNPTFITITNVSTLIIKNLIIEISINSAKYNLSNGLFLSFKDCLYISMIHIQTIPLYGSYFQLEGINIKGNSCFSHIILPQDSYIMLLYNETHINRRYYHHHVLTLNNCTVTTLEIDMLHESYTVLLKIVNTQILRNYFSICAKDLGKNEILISNCQFLSIYYKNYVFTFASSSIGSVKFFNCQFIDNGDDYYFNIIAPWLWKEAASPSLIKLYPHVTIKLINCVFSTNSLQTAGVLQTYYNMHPTNARVIIKNVSFTAYTIGGKFDKSYLKFNTNFITLTHTTLLIEDVVVFSNITTPNSIISLNGNSMIIVSGSVGFSHNHVHDLINFHYNDRKYFILNENSVISIINNEIWSLFITTVARYPYPFCLFQYLKNNASAVTLTNKKIFDYI